MRSGGMWKVKIYNYYIGYEWPLSEPSVWTTLTIYLLALIIINPDTYLEIKLIT